MKALVTGGAGFLGHHLVDELVRRGIDTIAYDTEDLDHIRKKGYRCFNMDCVTYVQGDILDLAALKHAMEDCTVVFHTAAIADLDEARRDPLKTMEINVIGTTKCLEAARSAGIDRFLLASSVYTAGKRGSFYRVSKQTCESLCKTYQSEYGIDYTIIRYGSLYGRESNQWNFIYNVCKSLLTSSEFTYVSSPESEREYIHISDATRETARIALNPEFRNKVVMITGHQRLKVKDLFLMIQEILGKDINIQYLPQEQQQHYIMTPYSYEVDAPIRVNLPTYIDISEGILDCLRSVEMDLKDEQSLDDAAIDQYTEVRV